MIKKLSMKLAATLIPLTISTIWVFIIMVKVLLGQIGDQELWRVSCSIAGFVVIIGFDLWLAYAIGKKYY